MRSPFVLTQVGGDRLLRVLTPTAVRSGARGESIRQAALEWATSLADFRVGQRTESLGAGDRFQARPMPHATGGSKSLSLRVYASDGYVKSISRFSHRRS